ncbi:hypothetical protein [Nitratireductor pacificus]|uniref:REJ domain-containing protein n=1 Tax=Nitratireductor pacificus pht-3B TaxID=391937 RepID=K2M6I0_9HYPH|nr:hypothetical protein [Nitratireductor pacificus]EKF17761.1 hypothetical protein NA2_15963 [Nitratireductor pacificus pht-3B]
MVSEADWETGRSAWSTRVNNAGIGALRVALLFGSAAVALALVLTPIAEKRSRPTVAQFGAPFGIDPITTSSTKRSGGTYTLRRSVLQPGRDAVCIIRENGQRSGAC